MDGTVVARRARWTLGIIFTTFLIINVVVLTMAFFASFKGNRSLLPPHLGDDVSVGVRLILVLIAGVASWFFARMLYKALVTNGVAPSDSVGPAYSLLSYLVLMVAAFAFLGVGTWLWLPMLFLIVLVWSLLSLWTLVGWIAMIIALVLALLSGVLTAYAIL